MSMSLQIINLCDIDLADAARLACARYKALRQQETLLPERYERVEEFLPKQESCSKKRRAWRPPAPGGW